MVLTVKEMQMLCVMHKGTVSATLALLREAENEQPERMAVVKSLITALMFSNIDAAAPRGIDKRRSAVFGGASFME